MEPPSPTPRRVSRPSWLDLRLVLGVVLVLAAVLIGARVVSAAQRTHKQVAVTHDLAAGSTLRAGDVELVDAQLPDHGRVYLTRTSDAVGRVLNRPLGRGELVPAAGVAASPVRTTVSIPFDADSAPALHRGERIVVWLSTKACPSVVVVPDVSVQDVREAGAGSFDAGGAGQDVTLALPPATAQRVIAALAIEGATVRAGVLTGPAAATPDTLPALDSCATSPSPTP